MKKMTLATAALTAMMALSTTSTTFAAKSQSVANSTGKVSLTAGDDTKPVAPTDPNPPTNENGPLSLDTVPNLVFASTKLTGADIPAINLDSINGAKDLDHADVQVTDVRGTGAGWQVTVQYGTSTEATEGDGDTATITPATAGQEWTNGTDFLKGAQLNFGAPTWNAGKTIDATKTDGAPSGATDAPMTVNDDAQVYGTAGKDEGMGTWLGYMKKSDITLGVPQSAKIGDYTANLVWTLSDTPK